MPEPACRKCGVLLTEATWFACRRREHDHVCKQCNLAVSTPSRLRRQAAGNTRYVEQRRTWVAATKTKARQTLGGVCQLCGTGDDLHFAHLFYESHDRQNLRGAVRSAREVLTRPDKFLLLCRECHLHPEKYLKELIELRAELAAQVA